MRRKRTPLARAMDDAYEDKGLTPSAIKERFEISDSTLKAWRLGRRAPKLMVAQELARLLGSSIEALWPSAQ